MHIIGIHKVLRRFFHGVKCLGYRNLNKCQIPTHLGLNSCQMPGGVGVGGGGRGDGHSWILLIHNCNYHLAYTNFVPLQTSILQIELCWIDKIATLESHWCCNQALPNPHPHPHRQNHLELFSCSSSLHDQGVLLHMVSSGKSQCASGNLVVPHMMEHSLTACAHCE